LQFFNSSSLSPCCGWTRQRKTKLRVVYDDSAREEDGSPSLSDCLLTGPNYVPMLFDILLRFRTYPVALTGDIEKAFLKRIDMPYGFYGFKIPLLLGAVFNLAD